MRIDKNEFFREITLRICGVLEIEKGLQECFQYISKHIPVDSLYLEKIDGNFDSLYVLAHANSKKANRINLLIPLSKEAKTALSDYENLWSDKNYPPVISIPNSKEEPVTHSILQALGEPVSSVMSLPLMIHDEVVGWLELVAHGTNVFNSYHEELVALLKEPFSIAMSNALKHEKVVQLKNVLADDNRYFQQELVVKTGENIIGSNFGLKAVMEMVSQVADLDSPVLLLGETGTGKDLVANAIHQSSSRRDQPFISVNCGAIPESLLDSELFGHEKGAFTGALSQKRGRFERAHNGTIFLDEVGELPPQAQVRLLRVLQNREIERVGGTQTIKLNIRIIAATNRDLENMIKDGTFREDLWFRLNVFPITLPPLRERKSDIPALLQHFITQKVRDLKFQSIPELKHGSIDILLDYKWPGNVRELENVVERSLILNRSGQISFEQLIRSEKKDPPTADEGTDDLANLDKVIARHIENVLKTTEGKVHGPNGAAEILGVNANTLRHRMTKLGIHYGRRYH
jgi:transcriptional regulator with GAF, ATPase, and Fis domain